MADLHNHLPIASPGGAARDPKTSLLVYNQRIRRSVPSKRAVTIQEAVWRIIPARAVRFSTEVHEALRIVAGPARHGNALRSMLDYFKHTLDSRTARLSGLVAGVLRQNT
jgi:uncharacterized protein YbgA (DUF1722 family)